MQQNAFENKLARVRGNAHSTKFFIERAWAPGRICTPITGCFITKQ